MVARIGIVAAAALGRFPEPCAKVGAAGPQGLERWREHVEHRLLSRGRFAARSDRVDSGGKGFRQKRKVGPIADRFAHGHEQAAVERARSAPDLHHESHADRLQRFPGRLRGYAVELKQHFLATALHVDPVVAVADRLIQQRELVGALDDVLGRRGDHRPENGGIERHDWNLIPPRRRCDARRRRNTAD